MVDLLRPRRGSMAFRPRKRSRTQNVSPYWQSVDEKRVIGFPGYKAGMTHISYIDESDSPFKGQEVVSAATVIEVPPVVVYGYRIYCEGNSISDELTRDEKILKMLNFRKPRSETNQTKPVHISEMKAKDVRLLVFAQPSKSAFGKKHVEAMELGLGGATLVEKLEHAKNLLGKELKAKDVFKPGEYLDVLSVSKGKGWQGAVKRFGVKIQRRKATGKMRHVGTLGQWHPAYVLYTVPQAGQMGYHRRTELNKMIFKIDSNVDEINPKGGFKNYGFIKSDYLLVKGSVPGPSKRLVKLRLAVRESGVKEPKVNYISLDSKR